MKLRQVEIDTFCLTRLIVRERAREGLVSKRKKKKRRRCALFRVISDAQLQSLIGHDHYMDNISFIFLECISFRVRRA